MLQKMFFHAEADSVNEGIYIMSSNKYIIDVGRLPILLFCNKFQNDY
jgi:hypothetical protein